MEKKCRLVHPVGRERHKKGVQLPAIALQRHVRRVERENDKERHPGELHGSDLRGKTLSDGSRCHREEESSVHFQEPVVQGPEGAPHRRDVLQGVE